jgi:uncharacterized membrane protein
VTSSSTDRKQLLSFGLIMAAAFGILALIRARHHTLDRVTFVYLAAGCAFALTGLALPRVLEPVYRVWMKLAEGLGWINTRIILVVVYYLVVTPIGLVMRLAGRSPIASRSDAKSYWKAGTRHSYGDKHFEKQF